MAETLNKKNIASFIEHTLLKPEATKDDIKKLCNEAIKHNFAGVCVPQYYVQTARNLLQEKPVKLVTVIGFPLGYNMISGKVEEAKKAIADGADELDMVMNIAAFKSKNFAYVKDDIESISTLCRLKNKTLKVIIETALLNEKEMEQACEIITGCDAHYVKTSTGYSTSGATPEIVQLLKKFLPASIKIKASGGINDRSFARELIEAGASRIGTSSGIKIIGNE